MIVADIGRYQALKGYVIKSIQDTLNNKIIEYKSKLEEILNLYTDEDINNAITFGITRVGDFVYMQTNGQYGKILRSLEYGTGRTKALHLVTQSVRKVIGGRI